MCSLLHEIVTPLYKHKQAVLPVEKEKQHTNKQANEKDARKASLSRLPTSCPCILLVNDFAHIIRPRLILFCLTTLCELTEPDLFLFFLKKIKVCFLRESLQFEGKKSSMNESYC